jgi:hypothetical protein
MKELKEAIFITVVSVEVIILNTIIILIEARLPKWINAPFAKQT